MAKWNLEKGLRDDAYATLESTDIVVVIPTTDIKPHEVWSYTCPCEVSIEAGDEEKAYDKPIIIHTRFDSRDAMNESLKRIYGKDN